MKAPVHLNRQVVVHYIVVQQPVVIWRSPEASSVVSGNVVQRFDAIDNVGIDSLKLYVNGTCPEGYTLQGHQNIEYSIIWVIEDIEDDAYDLTVIA